jgi:S-adenosylmethionine decarboxylase
MKRIGGTHLIVDGYVHDADNLDRKTVFTLFDSLVEQLGMKYLTAPTAHKVDLNPENLSDEHQDDGGWSYWCAITTSHISAHTWPLRKAVMLDVFSCRPFNFKLALSIINERLGLADHNHYVVDRFDPYGNNWSDSVCSIIRKRSE